MPCRNPCCTVAEGCPPHMDGPGLQPLAHDADRCPGALPRAGMRTRRWRFADGQFRIRAATGPPDAPSLPRGLVASALRPPASATFGAAGTRQQPVDWNPRATGQRPIPFQPGAAPQDTRTRKRPRAESPTHAPQPRRAEPPVPAFPLRLRVRRRRIASGLLSSSAHAPPRPFTPRRRRCPRGVRSRGTCVFRPPPRRSGPAGR